MSHVTVYLFNNFPGQTITSSSIVVAQNGVNQAFNVNNVEPGQLSIGNLYSFNPGTSTYWSVTATLSNGSVYSVNQKECELQQVDDTVSVVLVMGTETLVVAMNSGSCDAGVNS